MKYIIWGAGWRGKKILNILGEEHILYFVDSNPQKTGTIYCNKEVKGVDELDNLDRDCLVLISPAAGVSDIVDALEERNIKRYLCLNECPFFVELDKAEDDIFERYDLRFDFSACGIFGVSWFSLYFYDYLATRNIQAYMVPQSDISEEVLSCIKNEYEIKTIADISDSTDVLWVADEKQYKKSPISNHGGLTIIDINDYFEGHIKFCNHEIEKFKGIHQNQRCFIVATGPSLTVDDLNVLHDNHEICISMNRIYNIFSKTEWRPDYYLIEDEKMIEDLSEEIAELHLPHKFVSAKPETYWQQRDARSSIKYNMIVQDYDDMNVGFSRHLERCIYNGRTVTYACLQLAVYMGFKEIVLLGVDFNYSSDIYAESNHFEGYHHSYKEIRLNPIHPEKMLLAYEKAKEVCDAQGIKIYNATRGGKLEVFERTDFDKLFGGNRV